MRGAANDDVSAYTQVKISDASSGLRRNRRPKHWDYSEDPMVPVESNLFGHPLAGLPCERRLEDVLLHEGWEMYPLGMSLCSSARSSVHVYDTKKRLDEKPA